MTPSVTNPAPFPQQGNNSTPPQLLSIPRAIPAVLAFGCGVQSTALIGRPVKLCGWRLPCLI